MQHFMFQIHGNADHDGISELVSHFLANVEGLVSTGSGGFFTLLLPALSSIANVHPLFVHFPIALLTTFFCLELAAFFLKKEIVKIISSALLYLGTISAFLTVLAGFIAANSIPHGGNVHEIMENHEHIGIAILGLASFLSLWRWKFFTMAQGWFLTLAGLLVMLIVIGADLGGLMVYKYGVAVEAVPVSKDMMQHSH